MVLTFVQNIKRQEKQNKQLLAFKMTIVKGHSDQYLMSNNTLKKILSHIPLMNYFRFIIKYELWEKHM